jgi:hypothetical protein
MHEELRVDRLPKGGGRLRMFNWPPPRLRGDFLLLLSSNTLTYPTYEFVHLEASQLQVVETFRYFYTHFKPQLLIMAASIAPECNDIKE